MTIVIRQRAASNEKTNKYQLVDVDTALQLPRSHVDDDYDIFVCLMERLLDYWRGLRLPCKIASVS